MSHMNIINWHVCTLDDHGTRKTTPFKTPAKRRSYEASFKVKVGEFTEQHGNRAAGRSFSVDEKIVRGWRKQKEALQEMP